MRPLRPVVIAALYILIAIVTTWPLTRHLDSRLAADLGDPAFNCWVLAWTGGQMLAALRGDWGALVNFWHGNIFHPEPLTVAYSEHLTAQALQILPVYGATGNILIAYNLLFIATFALSGFGTYLLVRDLTGRPLAAFLAGLAFAYAPYRLGQFSHLQVLTSYWMPLTLFGFRRFFVTRRSRALAGGGAALVMQNLSCGYYLLFFSPFVAAYCLYEMAQRRLLRDWRLWTRLGLTAAAVALATWPFVRPYLHLRELGSLGVRTRDEIAMFSADTHAFGSIAPNSRLLADRLTGYVKPEGEGFVGFTILAFAVAGMVWGTGRMLRSLPWSSMREWQVLATAAAGLALAGSLFVLGWLFVHGSLALPISGEWVIYRNASRPLRMALLSGLLFVGLTALARRRVSSVSDTAFGFFVASLGASALLALGPRMEVLGRALGPGPYEWLLEYVPGFDGLRVPARFLMLVALFLSVLAGLGAAALQSTRYRRLAAGIVASGMIGILAESWVAPLQTNLPVIPSHGLMAPDPPAVGRHINPLYRLVRQLPDPVVLIEFPFGEPAYEILAVFYAGYHRRPLVNGYSGFFPQSYLDRAEALRDLPSNPDRAAESLRSSGATHAIVHEGAFAGEAGRDLSQWLESIGARAVTSAGTDKLFELR